MKHYFNPMSRAATTDWMLKELDTPHEQIIVDFLGGENNSPEFRAINPMGKVPVLVDGDAVVTETAEPLFSLTSLGIDHPNPQNAGWGDLPRVMATTESMTPEAGWALGEQFTAADVVFGGTLDFAIRFNWTTASPKIAAYVERIRARPAYRATHTVWA